jgi:hypothetical protein
MRIDPDIIYCTRDDAAPLALDLYRPIGPCRTMVLFAHGGGFFKGRKRGESVTRLALALTARGFGMASLQYRLGTGATAFERPERRRIRRNRLAAAAAGLTLAPRLYGAAYEAARLDLGAAIQFLRQSYARVACLGVSAGGIAGLSLAFPDSEDTPEMRPDAVMALGGAMVAPQRLGPDGAQSWMLNSGFDRVIRPVNARLVRAQAARLGAPLQVSFCKRRGHHAPIEALLSDADEHGQPYMKQMQGLFLESRPPKHQL